jgi:hypothetical protein
VHLRDSLELAKFLGVRVKLSEFDCERCQDKRPVPSGPKDFLDYTILPFFLIRHIRCKYCGDRYATFGFGKNRLVFRRKTTQTMRKVAAIVLFAVVAAGAVAFILLR